MNDGFYGESVQSDGRFDHLKQERLFFFNEIADAGGDPSDMGGPGLFFPTTEAKTVHVASSPGLNVTFDSANADNAITQSMATAFAQAMKTDGDIATVNISATTNGHIPLSNHGVGDALDINYINGTHIAQGGAGYAVALKLENAAKADPNVRYVEGPAGNFVRTAGPGSSWTSAPDMGKSELTHVHFEVFAKK